MTCPQISRMNILPALRRFVPLRLRPPLRKCLHLARSIVRPASAYDSRVQNELKAFADENVLATPPIMNYWAKTYLASMVQLRVRVRRPQSGDARPYYVDLAARRNEVELYCRRQR